MTTNITLSHLGNTIKLHPNTGAVQKQWFTLEFELPTKEYYVEYDIIHLTVVGEDNLIVSSTSHHQLKTHGKYCSFIISPFTILNNLKCEYECNIWGHIYFNPNMFHRLRVKDMSELHIYQNQYKIHYKLDPEIDNIILGHPNSSDIQDNIFKQLPIICAHELIWYSCYEGLFDTYKLYDDMYPTQE